MITKRENGRKKKSIKLLWAKQEKKMLFVKHKFSKGNEIDIKCEKHW